MSRRSAPATHHTPGENGLVNIKTSELAGQELEAWVAKALGAQAFASHWPDFEQLVERYAIQSSPMPGKGLQWCAVVVGRPGTNIPGGPWLEGPTPRIAVGRAIVAARFGLDLSAA